MRSNFMTTEFYQNTKRKVDMVFHQRKRPYNFIKTQKIRYG